MRNSKYWLVVFFLVFVNCLQTYRLLVFYTKTIIYKDMVNNASGFLPLCLKKTNVKDVDVDTLFNAGTFLLSTLSPHDCPVCLEREVRFLKVLHKEVPALPIIIIVSYYPSRGEIEPWLREWGLDFPYYFDPENTLEKMNGLRPSEAWNILVKNGQVITSFLPEENYFYKRAIFEFLHEYLKKIK